MRPHLPDLVGVVRRYLAEEGYPTRLALPVQLDIEVRYLLQLLDDALLTPHPPLLLALV